MGAMPVLAAKRVLLSRHANLAIEMRNRAREMFDLLATDGSASGGRIGQIIDEYALFGNPNQPNTGILPATARQTISVAGASK